MTGLFDFVTDIRIGVAENWRRGVASFVIICGKLALVGFLLWICIRKLVRPRQEGRHGGRATRRTATRTNKDVTAHADARRRSAWERQQNRLDELAAAALAAKQKRAELEDEIRTAALAVKEAKERARNCAFKADEVRMRRRRAEDQLRLSGDTIDSQAVRPLRKEAEQVVRQDKIARESVERAVEKFEELRRLLHET